MKNIKKRYPDLDVYPLVKTGNAEKLIIRGVGDYMILESSIRLIYAVLPLSLERKYKRLSE